MVPVALQSNGRVRRSWSTERVDQLSTGWTEAADRRPIRASPPGWGHRPRFPVGYGLCATGTRAGARMHWSDGRCALTVNPSRKLRRFESFTCHTVQIGPRLSTSSARGPISFCPGVPGGTRLTMAVRGLYAAYWPGEARRRRGCACHQQARSYSSFAANRLFTSQTRTTTGTREHLGVWALRPCQPAEVRAALFTATQLGGP